MHLSFKSSIITLDLSLGIMTFQRQVKVKVETRMRSFFPFSPFHKLIYMSMYSLPSDLQTFTVSLFLPPCPLASCFVRPEAKFRAKQYILLYVLITPDSSSLLKIDVLDKLMKNNSQLWKGGGAFQRVASAASQTHIIYTALP